MSNVSKLVWTPPTTNADGTPISPADAAALTYTAYIDTVNPPVKAYPIPPGAIVKLSPPAENGATMSVTAAGLGFIPTDGVTYYVAITATDTEGTSAQSAAASFTNKAVPSAPLDFSLA